MTDQQGIESGELSDFRKGVVDWIKHNTPADPGFLLPQTFMEVGSEQVLSFLREWQHKVWSSGYLGMAWPKEYGGGGMPRIFQQIADEEMKKARERIYLDLFMICTKLFRCTQIFFIVQYWGDFY